MQGVAQAVEATPIRALPTVGAPRPLRLVDVKGRPLSGSFSFPRFETRGDGLFFTRDDGKTRNIWRAFPDQRDTSRYPVWRALPITELEAPLSVENAVPLAGDDAFVAVSNYFSSGINNSGAGNNGVNNLVNYDLRASEEITRWTRLTNSNVRVDFPAPSPDGKIVIYTRFDGTASGVEAPALCAITSTGTENQTLAINARRAVWLNGANIAYENLAPPHVGIYSVLLDGKTQPQLILPGGGELAALPDGSGLVLSARSRNADFPQLYLIARDGSGLRALFETENARRPNVSSNGKFLVYDAPLDEKAERKLWIVPLISNNIRKTSALAEYSPTLRQLTNAFITPAPASANGKNLAGAPLPASSVNSSKNPSVPFARLSAARGLDNGSVAFIGAFDAGASGRVQLFVERNESGIWTPVPLLGVPRSATIGTEILATWRPPLAGRFRVVARLEAASKRGAAQSELRFEYPFANSNTLRTKPPVRLSQAPLPLPAPPTAPKPRPTPTVSPTPFPTPTTAPAPPPSVAPPSNPPTNNPPTMPSAPANTLPRDAADINVAGTFATATGGSKMHVAFWAQNKGNTTWRPQDVRLVARWVDFSTGTRRRWSFNWIRGVVAPGGQTKFELDIPVPPRAGKYKLIYGLVRVPAGGNYTPPPYGATQDSWPNEFAAIAFAVNVTAPTNNGPTDPDAPPRN